jgi:hypothetical protein
VPSWVHEFVAAPLALALTFRHAARALGARRAAAEVLALAAYGYALEVVAIAIFRSHRYADAWSIAPGGVPLAVAAVWAALIASAMALAGRRFAGTPVRLAAWAALLGLSLDLLIEPVATRLGLWAWTPPGPWLAVPLGNFVGWSVIVGAYAYGAERWGGLRRGPTAALDRALLAAACVLALVMVGLVWRGLEVEERLTERVGWLAAVLVWGLAAWGLPPARRVVEREPGLATRLARARGPEPAAVLLVLAAVFCVDAAWLGDRARVVLAAGALSALAVAVSRGRASSG